MNSGRLGFEHHCHYLACGLACQLSVVAALAKGKHRCGFSKTGADIPDELIRAVSNGDATFLCGAGVSFRVELPSFETLTERVYQKLGESPDGEAAERKAIAGREYDRALRSLEKRTHRPGTPSLVRDTVAGLLAAPSATLSDHLALLQLSRDKDGRPRLLTTNFDTLFERAALAADMKGRTQLCRCVLAPGGWRTRPRYSSSSWAD